MTFDLPEGWRLLTVMELAGLGGLVADGDWIESKDQDLDGDVRLIQLADIGDGDFQDRSARFLTSAKARELHCTMLETGDLLIARMPDPLGRACLFPGVGQPSITAVDVFIWRAGKKAADPRWLMYAINSPQVREHLQNIAGGTTRQRVSGGNLKRLELPTPPKAVQLRIAAKLDRLSERSKGTRDELNHIPKLAARYKQSMLDAAFRGDLTAGWRAANGGDVWQSETLDNLALDIRYGTAAKCHYEPKATPVLRIPNMAAGRIDIRDLKYGVFDARDVAKLALKRGDLLVIRSNGSPDLVGRIAIVDGPAVGYLFAGYLIRLRLNETRVLPDFVALAFEAPMVRRVVELFAKSTSGVHNINSEQLRSLEIPLPSLAEQHEIVRSVRAKFLQIDSILDETTKAKTLVDRLGRVFLARVFNGELIAPDLTATAEAMAAVE